MNRYILFVLLALSVACVPPAPPVPTNPDNPSDPSDPATPLPLPTPTAAPGDPPPVSDYFRPGPNLRYQIFKEDDGEYTRQLKIGTSIVTIEAVSDDYRDLKNQIDAIHAYNVKVICYHSLSVEPWRSDIGQFPSSAKGKKMSGWNEWWSDTRVSSAAHIFWDRRYDEFAKAGCDCVEDDNEVDAGDNETGFPLSHAESAASNVRRAKAAHDRGMCHIAKNNPGMSADYAKSSDGVFIEEAQKYGERDSYLPWKNSGKFAAMIEYTSSGCRPYPGFSVQYHSDGDYFSGVNYKVCD